MTTYNLKDAEFQALDGKVILIIGAVTGIGRATVELAHKYGAKIAIGDWNEQEGAEMVANMKERVLFRRCDVTKWSDVLALFEETYKAFGIIHAVLSNAGVNQEDFLQDQLDLETGKLRAPELKVLDINLIGMLYVVKCAVHFFRKWPETPTQIVMTGSAASYIDTPPLHMYCASKAGVLGLMRSLRTQLVKENITINMIAPWMTVTPMMLKEIIDIWGDLPANKPTGVGRALLLPIVCPKVNGKSFFVAGHEIVELEDTLHDTQPQWMGEDLSKSVDEGQRRLIP